ncbi:hypothetical protein ACIOHS_34910 [Streptomyces sp. NPDC088253]|uniref:hypothetical protein n=1 Tax=Streptomyces sp. NPDC088253 TaxID=3365846 RepID=UPI0037F54463
MQRTAGAWSPDVVAEHDPFVPEPLADFHKAAEDTVLAATEDGVRAMVIRPGLIWGPGDHGHMSMIYQSVAASGAACNVGQGLNTYSHVHIDDVTCASSRPGKPRSARGRRPGLSALLIR